MISLGKFLKNAIIYFVGIKIFNVIFRATPRKIVVEIVKAILVVTSDKIF